MPCWPWVDGGAAQAPLGAHLETAALCVPRLQHGPCGENLGEAWRGAGRREQVPGVGLCKPQGRDPFLCRVPGWF